MRVIETNDVLSPIPPLALDSYQFLGVYVVAIVRRIIARVTAARHVRNLALAAVHLAQQHPAALVRVGFLSVLAKHLVMRFADLEHCYGDELFPGLRLVPESLAEIFIARIA